MSYYALPDPEHDWAAEEADERARNEAFWRKIGREHDRPNREDKAAQRAARRADKKAEWHPHQPGEISDFEIWKLKIGESVSRETFVDQVASRRQLRDQSDRIVERLERSGIRARSDRGDLSFVDLVTGEAERSTDYRNTNFLPSVQSRNVHNMLLHVQHFCDKARPGSLRMFVISGGWVPITEYRDHHQAHCRLMTRFRYEASKRFGLELGYYNVENTLQRTEDGVAMVNLHSHALTEVRRRLSKDRWQDFLTFARGFFPKGYIHDSKIRDAKEVVKYVFKPVEFEQLSDDELAELYHQIQGRSQEETGEEHDQRALKFFHPLGRLKKLRASLRKQGRKLVRVQIGDGKSVWRTTEQRPSKGEPSKSGSGRTSNIALAVTNPLPYFSPVRRPVVVVQSYDGDFAELITGNRLEELRDRAMAMMSEKEAARRDGPLMKHTTTTTVRGEKPSAGHQGASAGPPRADSEGRSSVNVPHPASSARTTPLNPFSEQCHA